MSTSALSLGRLAALALVLVASGCAPDVPYTAPPASVVTATFDPVTGDIPLPNDLVLVDPASLPVAPVEKDLLTAFKQEGGFPNDQEQAVTISFARDLINADGSTTRVAPDIDPASFTPNAFFVFGVTAGGTVMGQVELDPIQPGDLVEDTSRHVTVLTLHHKGRTPWAPGSYAVFVRGGPNGVKTVEGDPVWASQVFFLVAQGQDMTKPENLSLLQAQTGSYDMALALATQLNMIIAGYGPAFAACDQLFPHQELASMAAFTIAPGKTVVEFDPLAGKLPLPVDLMRDPRPVSSTCAACGKILLQTACLLAGGTYDAGAGTCSTAAAAGFTALDGFSTTAPILAPTSDYVVASTVTASTYRLFDLTNPATPVEVPSSSFLIQPVELADPATGLTVAVAAQPVGATGADASSPFRGKPLKENTSYAVVVTKGVKDKAGNGLGRQTVNTFLLLDHPLVDGTGTSQIPGVDDQSAAVLEVMRSRLVPVRAKLAAEATPVTNENIAAAYTFKTQSFAMEAVQLGALPYTTPAATAAPGPVTTLTPAAAFTAYGVSPGVPSSNIQEILETDITTFNLLDPVTGAFNPAGPQGEVIHVMIAVPKTAPACAGAMAGFTAAGKTCAPMMVFRHGLGGGRLHMLLVADGYAAKGMVTVAIDAAKHGDRSYCTVGGPPQQCIVGTCQAVPGFTSQGDSTVPGRCTAGATNGDGLPARNPVAGGTCPGGPYTCGIPVFSANYLISANFFRTRDTFRQDIIDQSQLIRAIAFAPSGLPPTGHSVFDHMFGTPGALGVLIDPAQVYYSGQSMGAIQGTVDVAAIPRISKAVLNVGGGTLVDIFTTSPAFVDGVNALLAGMGIAPGTSAYLQFLAVAKLILDPADPINYAGHLTANTLPNLLPPLGGAQDGSVPQAAKKVLTQVALCDQTVPNTWSYVLDANAGTGPLPPAPGFGAGTGTFTLYAKAGSGLASVQAAIATCGTPGANATANAVEHGFFADWSWDPSFTARAQSDAADFVLSDTLPQSLVVLP